MTSEQEAQLAGMIQDYKDNKIDLVAILAFVNLVLDRSPVKKRKNEHK